MTRAVFFYLWMYYVKSSTLWNERKNKWALPSGAPERPICVILALFALWRQMGVPTYFFAHRVEDFHSPQIKEIGSCHRKLCRIENTPGQPAPTRSFKEYAWKIRLDTLLGVLI